VAVGFECLEVLLKLLPGDVAGMGIRDAREPVMTFALALNLPPISGAPIMAPTIGVGARITRVVQRSDSGRYSQRLEDRHRTVPEPGWKEKAVSPKSLDRLAGRTDARERFKKVGDRLPDLRVGIKHHVAGPMVCEAGWKHAAILAAAHLVQDPAAQAGFDDMGNRSHPLGQAALGTGIFGCGVPVRAAAMRSRA